MMNSKLEQDLQTCLSMIRADWEMQNNYLDKQTNFIYRCDSLEKCLEQI